MAPEWLTARPIAHRGLHDEARGVVENTLSAAEAAVAGNYAMETDVQLSADGEVMVFHDDTLERLTEGAGPVDALPRAALQRLAFKGTSDRMPTLGELCALVAGRVPLVVELKSRFDGDTHIAQRAVAVLASYAGPAALMSFDPDLVAAVRRLDPGRPRGIIAERRYAEGWDFLPPARRRALALFLHAPISRPQFVAYNVQEFPSLPAWTARTLFGLPLLTWTVRTDADRQRARRYADQMIFEGFRA